VITLDAADLVLIAGQILGVGTDDALRQLDVPAAQAALAEARIAGSAIVDQDTAAAAAIGLVHALLRHRPYARHGERIAVAAGLQFLSLNRWSADLEPPAAAAVVVEALACGQLSPAGAAAWLSPRLAASAGRIAWAPASIPHRRAVMSGTSASPRKPIHPAARRRQPKPPSVRYPQVLLFVQAGFWALAAAIALCADVAALAKQTWPPGAVPLAWSALAGGLAIGEVMLGLGLDRSPSKRMWRAVIGAELAMTGFGVLWLAVPAYGFIILGFFGACLSLAAVVCMTRPRARQYFAGPAAVPGTPDPDAPSGPAGFWALALASQRLALT
jgi:hypothetical protein